MKKIINGKKYNTETANEVGYASSDLPVNDFGWWEETLYKKKTGEFFLYGSGNAASKYSTSCGQNCWSGGENIIPLTESAARSWAERYLSVDTYEAIFGEVDE